MWLMLMARWVSRRRQTEATATATITIIHSMQKDDDEFWQVALEGSGVENNIFVGEHDASEEEDDDAGEPCRSTEIVHRLEFPDYPSLSLRLRSLPLSQCIRSPLGAQAWYGSALLTALLLSDATAGARIHQHLESFSSSEQCVSALELGSGAVGLSSLALGWMLKHRPKGRSCQKQDDRIVLTDNDNHVLQQLRENIKFNIERIEPQSVSTMPKYQVEHLDWNDGYNRKALFRNSSLHTHGNETEPSFPSASLQLVVGSELVYTTETARACAHVVRSILDQNPNVLIAIVQVADRDGWDDIFLPTLRQAEGVCVEDMFLVDAVLHERASRLIRHGGTMDRFGFALCYISKSNDCSQSGTTTTSIWCTGRAV
jgi:hypothetical protein